MEVLARVGSNGRVTIPRAVRDALAIEEGDQLVFKVQGRRATMARSPDLLELAAFISVPASKRGTPWSDVLRNTRLARLRRNAGAVTMTTDEIMAHTRGE